MLRLSAAAFLLLQVAAAQNTPPVSPVHRDTSDAANAALLDPRLHHISIDHVLTSYRSLVDAPLPIGAPEDIIPGVLLHYDLPDLVRALGPRLTETDPLQGADDLSQASTPLATLEH